MLLSMTGFGRTLQDAVFGRIIVEIQSVNRKYLEIAVVLPKEMGRFEMDIRKWVCERVARGQITVRILFMPSENALEKMLPDAVVLKRLKNAWTQIAFESGTDPRSIDLPFLLEHIPAAIASNRQEDDEMCRETLGQCVAGALKELSDMKTREGQILVIDLNARLRELERMICQIESFSPQSVAKQREKLRERVLEVLQPGTDLDERIMRELALFADRVDISEEITRFRSHIAQFYEIIDTSRVPAGRKLDFLVQEIGRELNTIGSKSTEAAITRLVVEMKSELEKIREQIQNIE
jgi:uncharacterized protein (TIGR00255 family)